MPIIDRPRGQELANELEDPSKFSAWLDANIHFTAEYIKAPVTIHNEATNTTQWFKPIWVVPGRKTFNLRRSAENRFRRTSSSAFEEDHAYESFFNCLNAYLAEHCGELVDLPFLISTFESVAKENKSVQIHEVGGVTG